MPTLKGNKTIAEGRRIPISEAVENPTATEIQDVCSEVGLNVFLEKNKMYSREWNHDVQYRDRVPVQLKTGRGRPLPSCHASPQFRNIKEMPSTARLWDISGCSLMPSVTINVGLVEEQSLGPPP
ncbi:hypothetical protein H8959_016091 [Pygathrix nigripes]